MVSKISRKERAVLLKASLDELADNIVTDTERLAEFTREWSGGFHRYSMNNMLLVKSVKPEASLLAGHQAWETKHNRKVRRGEKGIWIIAPVPVKIEDEDSGEEKVFLKWTSVPVWDISQTDGDPVDVGCPNMINGDMSFDDIKTKVPFDIIVKDLGLSNGRTDGKTCWITPKLNKTAMAGTLIHEVAHCKLGHITEDFMDFESETRVDAKEIEAEAVKFVVLSYFGVHDERAKFYIGNWSAFGAELKGRGKKILSVAEQIIRWLEAED